MTEYLTPLDRGGAGQRLTANNAQTDWQYLHLLPWDFLRLQPSVNMRLFITKRRRDRGHTWESASAAATVAETSTTPDPETVEASEVGEEGAAGRVEVIGSRGLSKDADGGETSDSDTGSEVAIETRGSVEVEEDDSGWSLPKVDDEDGSPMLVLALVGAVMRLSATGAVSGAAGVSEAELGVSVLEADSGDRVTMPDKDGVGVGEALATALDESVVLADVDSLLRRESLVGANKASEAEAEGEVLVPTTVSELDDGKTNADADVRGTVPALMAGSSTSPTITRQNRPPTIPSPSGTPCVDGLSSTIRHSSVMRPNDLPGRFFST